MAYRQSEMLYNDGSYYKWTASADKDNPYYTRGADYSELNKTEGYEVLYFINHLMIRKFINVNLKGYHKMERAIRHSVPGKCTHAQAEKYICANWDALR